MTETETAERVGVACPACAPDVETVHEVLTTGGGRATVRCTDCGHVHKEKLASETTDELSVVVSQDGESFTSSVDAPREETLAVGEEFVLEDDDAIMQVRITALELADDQRRQRADVTDVETIWTRVVDNVSVDVTVNPVDGRHDQSRSVTVYVPGDYEFTVGETDSFGDETLDVKSLLLRDDARGYPAEQLEEEGDTATAKDCQRVYADDAGDDTEPWSAW